ncbi:hypothetical protein [Clostridium sp. CF012]|uniref:hypothetical protein n=1 Tax=Clostridium sp. CF012 TaxID=2843319 RepID=UPI001C0E3CEE|nr:hypothetical protein [Clostridium sp. CF012]MBU3145397.1 hypothetical protein [Clostridium sp. CF012]
MEYGKRIIFDKLTGKVLDNCFGEMSGDLQEGLRPLEIDFVDLKYGDITLQEVAEYHIEIATKTIIIDSKIEHIQTEAERIAELENIILESEGVI